LEYYLKYNDTLKPIKIPEKAEVTVLEPKSFSARNSTIELLERSLESARFKERLRKKNPASVAIAIQDIIKPVPIASVLPRIIEQLTQILPHLNASSITIILASRPHPESILEGSDNTLISFVLNNCNVVFHDAHDAPMKDFGATSRGTPVKINAAFGEADFKMVVGLIEPHQFFGFTGGVKEAVIGCGSEDSIKHNHDLINQMPVDESLFGKTPMREDIDEAGRLIGIDFAVDLVLNADCQVVHVFSGDVEDVFHQGMEACQTIFGIEPGKKFDLVLATCADASDDLGFYRAQKIFSLVSHITKKGGKILLLAALHKGLGEDVYFDYVCPSTDPAAIIEAFINFWHAMGALPADRFGGMLLDCKGLNISNLDNGIMKHCHLRAADPSSIMAEWVDDFRGIPEVAVIPRGASTYFF